MASGGRTGAAAWSTRGRAPATVGLYGTEETTRRVSQPAAEDCSATPAKGHTKPAFVELVARHPATVDEFIIEFESSHGGKMRIQWKAAAIPDWSSLLRAWRETGG
jgi:hypothetical protein